MSVNNKSPNNTSISTALTDTSSSGSGLPIPVIAGAAGGFLIIVIIVVIIIIIKRRRAVRANIKSDIELKKNPTIKDEIGAKSIKNEEEFGGEGHVSFDPNENENKSHKFDLTNEIPLDKSSRQLLKNNPYVNPETQDFHIDKIVAMFSEKLKGIQKEHKEINILDEIKIMMHNKTQTQTDDDVKSHGINSDKSHVSGQSAHRIAKKHSHNAVICYTDEHRDQPDEQFYNQKIENFREERERYEKEEEEARVKELQLEQRLKNRVKNFSKIDEDDDIVKYLGGEDDKFNDLLNVKVQAIMTDFSQPVDVVIMKNDKV